MSSLLTDLSSEESAYLAGQAWITDTFQRLDTARRLQVIAAILEESSARGPRHLNIKSAAKRAGIPVGSLYQYFRDREALLSAATWLVATRLARQLTEFGPELCQVPLKKGLEMYLTGAFTWSEQESGYLRFFAQAVYRDAWENHTDAMRLELITPVARAMQNLIRDMLQAARRRGEISRHIPLDNATRIVHTLLCASGDAVLLPGLNDYYQLFQEHHSPKKQVRAIVQFIVAALGAPRH